MWPAKVQRQCDIAQAAGIDALENLTRTSRSSPTFKEINLTKGADYLVTFEIFLENLPVFVLQPKREKDFSVRSKRTAADDQLRVRVGDLIDPCPLPVFHGVSAFGTKLCFYSITKAGLVSPECIPASAQYVTDTAPVDRWNYDILTDEGETELRRIIQVITTECAQLPQ